MHIAILLNDLSGGGVERTMLALASGYLTRGQAVDPVPAQHAGPLEGEAPAGTRAADSPPLAPGGGKNGPVELAT